VTQPIVSTSPGAHGAVVPPAPQPDIGCVVLTMGNRPEQLRHGLESLRRQRGVHLDIVVVGNGWQPTGLPPGVRSVALPENVGIPAGRNAGVIEAKGDLIFTMDDDVSLVDDGTLAGLAELFAVNPTLGVVQLHAVDPTGVVSPRRQVPRLRAGDPYRSSDVTAVWEGGCGYRREVFARAGLFAEDFWYAHEGIDFAWRAMDAGFRVRYAGHLVCHHPAVDQPKRHGYFHYLSARNRVWLARRHLPLPFAVLYQRVWLVLTLLRTRDPRGLRDTVRGYRDGLVKSAGPRRPIGWRTVWRMTRAGRPPVI
jgi:GT2 family glycosyltransferase